MNSQILVKSKVIDIEFGIKVPLYIVYICISNILLNVFNTLTVSFLCVKIVSSLRHEPILHFQPICSINTAFTYTNFVLNLLLGIIRDCVGYLPVHTSLDCCLLLLLVLNFYCTRIFNIYFMPPSTASRRFGSLCVAAADDVIMAHTFRTAEQ